MSFTPDPPRRRGAGPRAIGRLAAPLLRPAAQRHGFATAELLACWPAIAGPRIAGCAVPERLVGRFGQAVLTLRVTPARALDVEYARPALLARLAAALGPGTIGAIRIVQGPVPPPQTDRAPPALLQKPDGLGAALTRLATARAAVADGHAAGRCLSEGQVFRRGVP